MRILIFSLSYIPLVGGAEVAVKEITDRIDDVEFDMVTLRFKKEHPEFEKIGNIDVYRIGGGFGYLSKILFLVQAATFARHRKYDAYWSIMTYMLAPAVLAGRAPHILTLQDGDPFSHVFNRWFIIPFRSILRKGFRDATRVQAISNFLAGWAKQMGYKREVEVIPNGVDVEKFKSQKSKVKSDDTILITTSRLVEKNGVGDIIKSLKFLPDSINLQIVGSGRLENNLKSQVQNLNLENRVEFIGEISNSDISLYLSNADIFVRPSLSEGQGISFLEAMAAGLPIIGTPVGGIVDFLKDGETGLFCKPNDPKSVAQAIQRLVDDGILREKIISNASKLVRERYDWDQIAQEMKTSVFDKI